jgi:hypothetical protein
VKLGYEGRASTHGFRSTFRDWCGECTSFPRELAEKALSHKKDDVEEAYQRSALLEKRRRLMVAWAEFCLKPAVVKPEPATVTSFPSFLRKVVGK